MRDISYISYSFISDYYQILVEINRKDILDYDYQITEQDSKNFFVYFGDDAYLENDYQIITDYQTFYDLFKNSSATWYSYSVLALVSESLFDDYYVFAYQRSKGVHLNAQLYDYHINLNRVNTEVSYVLYLTFVDDYSYQLTAFDDSLTTLYLLMIPNTLLMDFEYVIIHGLSDGQIIYDLP
ncbi:MAG: hypothetical protein LRY20_00685 [Acholeplasmataceae bacterium]|nr:hypothetical protein [Acholeplasmataceae bacterium]